MFATAIFLAILQTAQLTIGEHTVSVEIADSPKAQEKGLMGRNYLPQNTGMLFVFKKPQLLMFWMKNMLVPLSLAYFDENKKLIEIIDMPLPHQGARSIPFFKSSKPALYALEVPQRWFEEHGIKIGMEFSFLDRTDDLQSLECEKNTKSLGESFSPSS